MGLTGGDFEFSAAHPQKEIPLSFCLYVKMPSNSILGRHRDRREEEGRETFLLSSS